MGVLSVQTVQPPSGVTRLLSRRPVWSTGEMWSLFCRHIGVSNGRIESSARSSGVPYLSLSRILEIPEGELVSGSVESEIWHEVHHHRGLGELSLTTGMSDRARRGDHKSAIFLLEHVYGYVPRGRFSVNGVEGVLEESSLELDIRK